MDPSKFEDLVQTTKKPSHSMKEMTQRIRVALRSPKGVKLAVSCENVGDTLVIIYQGLRSNVWGRIEQGKIIIYNHKLNTLLASHPSTKIYFKD